MYKLAKCSEIYQLQIGIVFCIEILSCKRPGKVFDSLFTLDCCRYVTCVGTVDKDSVAKINTGTRQHHKALAVQTEKEI